MTTRTEIESLLYLMDDPDAFVRESVLNRFQELGENAVPLLDEIQVTTSKTDHKQFLQDLIFQLTFPVLEQEFLNHIEPGINSYEQLENGMFLLSRFHNSTLRAETYRRKLDRLADIAAYEIQYSLNPIRKMEILLNHIFITEKFKAAGKKYYHADHSYLSRVLDSKKGNPISLSLVVILVAHRLELPFSGVNMPVHFLLRFDHENEIIYLDPYNAGAPITLGECNLFLRRNGIQPEASMFEPASPVDILARSMRNLIHSYTTSGDNRRLEPMKILLSHLEIQYLRTN